MASGSDHEEKWALEEEKKRLEKLARRKEEEARKHRQEECYMHCPKCGAHLKTITVEGLEVDECPECRGIWFDAGELVTWQKLNEEKKKSFLDKVFGSFFGG